MSDAESWFWAAVFFIACALWYITIPILIIWFLVWLYKKGEKKTCKVIIILLIAIPLIGFAVSEGPHLWRNFRHERRLQQEHEDFENSPEGIIQEKEQSISAMKRNLEKQLESISEVRNKYQGDIRAFLEEISEEKQKYSISSIATATERILYDVQLIRERDASISKLNEIERVTKSGLEESIYMLRQLDGAKGMAKIMVGGNALADNAEKILKKYSSYADAIAINPKELKFKSPEAIWQQYVK